ncbi:hypothetical protein FHS89_001777 [Rubricella aquisinus]|uniref:Uncharacterized protein n=1 Tax=Rubricella aquisinus TaxID=2028108 RepID=A0A840X4Y9_9RHOB|nr:hypothetical protein [Rubricella aquisinus]MBB5515757.1 hypothetical protein [Rubricella aquisinus]
MDIFSMIFAIVMLTAAVAAAILVGFVAGGMWGGVLFAAVLWLAYRAATHQSGPSRALRREALNAFQRPLADD